MVRRPGARAQVSCRAVEFVVKVVLRPAIELNFAIASWAKLAKRNRFNTVLLKQSSRVASFLASASHCALTSVAWPGTRDRLKCFSKCKNHRQVSVVSICSGVLSSFGLEVIASFVSLTVALQYFRQCHASHSVSWAKFLPA